MTGPLAAALAATVAVLVATPSKVEIDVETFGGKKLQVTAVSADTGLSADWRLTGLPDPPIKVGADGAAPTLTIEGAAKRISGSTGCNQFFGTAAVGNGSALTLDPSGMTRMACPDAVMALESAFLGALRGTTSYRIRGATLELREGDRVLARFERRRVATPSE